MNNIEEIMNVIGIALAIVTFLLNTGCALKAIELCKESLVLLSNKALSIEKQFGKLIYRRIYHTMFTAYCRIHDNTNAIIYGRKLLVIYCEHGDTVREGYFSVHLAQVYSSQNKYIEAKELYERAITIMRETGNKKGEAASYGHLGNVFHSLGDYVKAKEFYEKALAINMEIDDRDGEASGYGSLGTVFRSLGDYVKAKEFYEKALAINMEIGDRAQEGINYQNLGAVFHSLGDYVKAKEFYEKALAITMEISDRAGEATNYGNLGTAAGEAASYGNLGTVFQSLGDYVKAKEYLEKALAINMEIGDRAGEATNYGKLGTVFQSLGDYVKAKEFYEKSLAINKEIGDRKMEAVIYTSLGTLFHSLGDKVKAKEFHEKALAIKKEIGDRKEVAINYGNLGTVFNSLKQYRKSKQYHEKALAISMKTGDRAGEAITYRNLGSFSESLGDNVKAEEYYKKALAITIEIGNRTQEAAIYLCLGEVFTKLRKYLMAEEYLGKALQLSKDIRHSETEFRCYCSLTVMKLAQKNFQEAYRYLLRSIEKCEDLRGFNTGNDEINISFADMHVFPYEKLSELFCDDGNPNCSLYVVEMGRARALADLMATQYSAETHISPNPQSWSGIENVMTAQNNCTCLYISYHCCRVSLFIVNTSGVVSFRKMRVDHKNTLHKRLAQPAKNLDEFFAIMAKSFRSFGILPEEVCEDRSLNDIEQAESDSSQEESHAALRDAKGEENPEPSLTLFHEMLINPVSDLLEEPEIIIVPDRNLYRVPFPALLDGNGKFLSESFRIRVIPSLTTLKLIQESPADYHSQTGALIVGDPDVGEVIYCGSLNRKFVPLPGARKEAEMIGRLLGVQPLIGEHATKQAVLQRIASVSLIHIAAHGSAERGEIALAPPGSTSEIPQEDNYLLQMSDISKVQLRAKLVVLSCCHSGRGQIKAEGAVGIARAFLGSGARSVLVALWALEDSATKQFMSCFYHHLVRGESASESLYRAMKWMRDKKWWRGNNTPEVSEWAPFMLIGDNVTFDFGKQKKRPNHWRIPLKTNSSIELRIFCD
ncbi:hypothetical protein ACROYT_G034347 [Oculina patagonica]